MNIDTVKKILNIIKNTKILVVGDIMTDEYIFGRVERISPEAPVPVFIPERKETRPGGAANVEANIKSLGAKCFMVSPNYHQKSVKTRYVASPYNQQLLRVDKDVFVFPETAKQTMLFIGKLIHEVNAVIIADYNKGIITEELLKEVLPYLNRYNMPVFVDPTVNHFEYYKNVTCITPNLKEASEGFGLKSVPTSEKEIETLGWNIMEKLKCVSLLITRGEHGMTLFTDCVSNIPTTAQKVFDVSGAGDTVISAFVLANCAGFGFETSAEFASLCAGIVVGKVGTAVVSPEELFNLEGI